MNEKKNKSRIWDSLKRRALTIKQPEPENDPKPGNIKTRQTHDVNYRTDYGEQKIYFQDNDHASTTAGAQYDRSQAQLNLARFNSPNLRSLIMAAMTNLHPPKIGLDSPEPYLPESKLKVLVKEENVKKIYEDPALVQFIINDAPKTFAIALLAIEDSSKLLKAMEGFRHHGFTDKFLPIKDLSGAVACNAWSAERTSVCGAECKAMNGRKCHGMHHAALDVFHHSCWDAISFKHFYGDQWSFLVQKFELEKFEYNNIDAKIVLPFVPTAAEQEGKGGKAGYFSEVSHAKMLTEYHDSYDPVSVLH